MGHGRPASPVEVRRRFWKLVQSGVLPGDAAAGAGVAVATASRWFRDAGGVIPSIVREPSGYRLSLAEREELACLRAAGGGVRQIGRTMSRDAATISRERRRGTVRAKTGYRASVAQAGADARAARPKSARLAVNARLREHVQDKLARKHSPEQIAAMLPAEFPGGPEMRVSHETICQSLYVQGRGALRRELTACLRTGRALRKPRRKEGERRRGKIPGMVSISERPAEAADRAVPGHWEGDLITGAASKSAIGTLVERMTGFTMLLHLPAGHGALQVQDAMAEVMSGLPQALRQTLTWDQGSEMASHVAIAAATGLDIYFADPHSPWQRGSNENTNGLLRQYFPKSTDLSGCHRGYLAYVAAELNSRPRKRLGWQTPAQALGKLLSEPFKPPGVAMTG